jgi:hypothetical protein
MSSRFTKPEDSAVGLLSTTLHKGGKTSAAEFAKSLPPLLGSTSQVTFSFLFFFVFFYSFSFLLSLSLSFPIFFSFLKRIP